MLNGGVVMVQFVGYTVSAICFAGAACGFVAVAWQGLCYVAQMVQRTNVAAYTPNAPLTPHNAR